MGVFKIAIVTHFLGHLCLVSEGQTKNVCNSPMMRRDPFFENRVSVIDKWTTRYIWGGNKDLYYCYYTTFQKVNPWTITWYKETVAPYLKTKPKWASAKLLMKINSTRQILLIPDEKYRNVSRFLGVPNVFAGNYYVMQKEQTPLHEVVIKVFENETYLIISDCDNDVTILLDREEVFKAEDNLQEIISNFDFGEDGVFACKEETSNAVPNIIYDEVNVVK